MPVSTGGIFLPICGIAAAPKCSRPPPRLGRYSSHCNSEAAHAKGHSKKRFEKWMLCAIMSITRCGKEKRMLIEVDFNSDEAIYIQLCNQIILGIATSVIQEGDSLPSVRQLADTIGVNMHTVNKAYSVLKREGYISLDKRRGAVIALDIDKMEQLEEMRRQLRIVLARGRCKKISRQEVHDLVDEIFDDYE